MNNRALHLVTRWHWRTKSRLANLTHPLLLSGKNAPFVAKFAFYEAFFFLRTQSAILPFSFPRPKLC